MSLVVPLLLYFASDVTKESFSSVIGDKVLIDKPGGFQGNTSRKASSSSGHTSLHSGKGGSDPLQSEAFRKPSSGVFPSLYSDKPGGFEDLAAAESKKTPQKGQ